MKLVVDAVGVRHGSAAIVIGNLLHGWSQQVPEDEIALLVDGDVEFAVPSTVSVHRLATRTGLLTRLFAQTVGVRLSCRRLEADALLSALTAGALFGVRCPSGAIVYDMRHELRKDQFPRWRRVMRKLLYGWTFRRADALFCISERTRADLIRTRPQLAAKARATLLGADHAANWRPSGIASGGYLLAFGHFPNKNLESVLRAWASFDNNDGRTLQVCGLGHDGREVATRLVTQLGIADRVKLLGWLADEEFQSVFAGAAAILFPSDFEGFGLPVAEALLLGIPVMISTDPALLEVSAGHAVVAQDDRPESLARAISCALERSPQQVEAGVAYARSLTWARMAFEIRDALVDAGTRRRHGDDY